MHFTFVQRYYYYSFSSCKEASGIFFFCQGRTLHSISTQALLLHGCYERVEWGQPPSKAPKLFPMLFPSSFAPPKKMRPSCKRGVLRCGLHVPAVLVSEWRSFDGFLTDFRRSFDGFLTDFFFFLDPKWSETGHFFFCNISLFGVCMGHGVDRLSGSTTDVLKKSAIGVKHESYSSDEPQKIQGVPLP